MELYFSLNTQKKTKFLKQKQQFSLISFEKKKKITTIIKLKIQIKAQLSAFVQQEQQHILNLTIIKKKKI